MTLLDARRSQLKAAGQRVSFTHLIAYAIARAATDDIRSWPTTSQRSTASPTGSMTAPVNLGLAVDVEKQNGSRTLMVPVIRDAGRLSFGEFLDAYNALVEKARTNTLTADDLIGANLTLTNPGGIGTIASVPRLMAGQGTILATGSIAYPIGLGARRRGDRGREGHVDDLDLRPPHHPGRRVRPLPRPDRGVPPGRARVLRGGLRLDSASPLPAPAPAAGAARRRPGRRRPAAPAAPAIVADAARGADAGRPGRRPRC